MNGTKRYSSNAQTKLCNDKDVDKPDITERIIDRLDDILQELGRTDYCNPEDDLKRIDVLLNQIADYQNSPAAFRSCDHVRIVKTLIPIIQRAAKAKKRNLEDFQRLEKRTNKQKEDLTQREEKVGNAEQEKLKTEREELKQAKLELKAKEELLLKDRKEFEENRKTYYEDMEKRHKELQNVVESRNGLRVNIELQAVKRWLTDLWNNFKSLWPSTGDDLKGNNSKKNTNSNTGNTVNGNRGGGSTANNGEGSGNSSNSATTTATSSGNSSAGNNSTGPGP